MSFRRILIALDDSAIAAHAVEVGTELATALKAEAALVYVVDPTLGFQPDGGIPAAEWVATLKREGQSLLATAVQRTGQPLAWQFLRDGKRADQILAAAREWEGDVMVIGTHGRSGVSRLVLGSTAESVVVVALLTGVSTDTLRHYERKECSALRLAAKADIDCIRPKPSRTYDSCVARWPSASA